MNPLISRFIPLLGLAALGITAAIRTAHHTTVSAEVPPLSQMPQRGPWSARLSASGLIEATGENTIVGVPEAALVVEVAVAVGQQVRSGELLFRLDDRLVQAELAVANRELQAARTRLQRLEALPRPEDAEPAAARLAVAEARLNDARVHHLRYQRLNSEELVTTEAFDIRRGAEAIAAAEVARAEAELAHAKLPAWQPDLLLAEADVALLEARVSAIRTRLERLEITARRDATVVSIGVTAGAIAVPGDRDLLVLADLRQLVVRLEVDEAQAWRLLEGEPGVGWIRGDTVHQVELEFDRTEPMAAPRGAFAGTPGERFDGRAVQVLYRLVNPPRFMRPGLMLEVDLQADPVTSRTVGDQAVDNP